MPIPYADLQIDSITFSDQAESGQPLEITWTVSNQGLGLTNRGSWRDSIHLYADPDGKDYVADQWLSHLGQVPVGGSYTHTHSFPLPEGLEGTYYLAITAAHADGPFEFVFRDNNRSAPLPIEVQLSPFADLVLTDIVTPQSIEEGGLIDISWTVANEGASTAAGSWVDRVALQKAYDTSAPIIRLGDFKYQQPMPASTQYTRQEVVRLPKHIMGDFRIIVIADLDNEVYEHGATANNKLVDDSVLSVTLTPRPDLQVTSLAAPTTVDPGGTLVVEYVVTNQSMVPTTTPNWTDRVYLSLDNQLNADDVLIGTLGNQSALRGGESYQATSDPLVVPKRFRGDAYVIVATDVYSQVDEWPNDDNNHTVTPIFVNLTPLADLVTSDVVAPQQAVAGAEIEVRYTVTNLGAGETDTDRWQDTIWLTRDKNRPHPGEGDLLLKTVTHTGVLDVGGGYDQQVSVRLPEYLETGTWYITPWTDPYGAVLEDTLASNVNPDDPHEIDNNNYKARAIDVISLPAPLPDLVVEAVEVVPVAYGGETYEVTWTVRNTGLGIAEPGGGWADRILLSNDADATTSASHVYILDWTVKHDQPLGPGESYTKSRLYQLSPSAAGKYIIVTTDASVTYALPPSWVVRETDEGNNNLVVPTDVQPVPADLLVTEISAQGVNYSGEPTTLQYTVTNVGSLPVWSGTKYWKDHIWISADSQFIYERATYLGTVVHSHEQLLGPGDSYEVQFETELPTGLDGDYYFYVHLDAHSSEKYRPVLDPLGQGWWVTDEAWYGWRDNRILVQKHFDRWAFEDPSNNLASVPLSVTYREANLVISDLVLPAETTSGAVVPMTYTVTNEGTRETRRAGWQDKFFLSEDPTLDPGDHFLGSSKYVAMLPAGESYTRTVEVRVPPGIGGEYYILAYVDSAAHDGISGQGSIRAGLRGIRFEEPLASGRLGQRRSLRRLVSRAVVSEFQDEGDNIAVLPLTVEAATPPDLQVTALSAPQRAMKGQPIDVSYTVSNVGGDTISDQGRWTDLIYLSRDELLDTRVDRYLGSHHHTGGMIANESYDIQSTLKLPPDVSGPYYVMVVADPVRYTVSGEVLELDEFNNSRPMRRAAGDRVAATDGSGSYADRDSRTRSVPGTPCKFNGPCTMPARNWHPARGPMPSTFRTTECGI